MLKKIYKKSIVVLFMTIAMVVSIVVNVSAAGEGDFGTASGKCSHGHIGIGAYAWNPNNYQAMAVMDTHTGCSAVKVYATIIISRNGTMSVLAPIIANGIVKDGVLEAKIDYTPPSGTIIVSAGASYTCCDATLR